MMNGKLILAVPSKGRLLDQTAAIFARAGMTLAKSGHHRGYRGAIEAIDTVEVAFLSASEIVRELQMGRVHLGVTGEDLVREYIASPEGKVDFLHRLGFGHADVAVAAPACWIDVRNMADLEEAGAIFYGLHGRRLRVATKYMNLTRRFFAEKGVASYRIVESLGATEGAPAAGTAEVIVDITTTGATLKANHLKVLTDGVILRSQANLVASRLAVWTGAARSASEMIAERLSAAYQNRPSDP